MSPASPQALATLRLFALVCAIGAAVFVAVAGIILIAAIRLHDRPGWGDPVPD